jgi:hypothetical protein
MTKSPLLKLVIGSIRLLFVGSLLLIGDWYLIVHFQLPNWRGQRCQLRKINENHPHKKCTNGSLSADSHSANKALKDVETKVKYLTLAWTVPTCSSKVATTTILSPECFFCVHVFGWVSDWVLCVSVNLIGLLFSFAVLCFFLWRLFTHGLNWPVLLYHSIWVWKF